MAWGVGRRRPLQCLVSKTPWYAQRVLRVAVTNGVVHPRTKRRQNTIEPESRDSLGCLLLQYCCSLASGQSWRSRMNKEKVKGFWKKRERRWKKIWRGFFWMMFNRGIRRNNGYKCIVCIHIYAFEFWILKFRVSEKDIFYMIVFLYKFLHPPGFRKYYS